MAITNLTDDLKEAMLGRLDPTRTIVDTGLEKVILLDRDELEYDPGGIYGGFKDITWLSSGDTGYEEGTLKQDADLIFDVEANIRISGYKIYHNDGTTSTVGITQLTSEYVFDEDGTFTISNIEITLG